MKDVLSHVNFSLNEYNHRTPTEYDIGRASVYREVQRKIEESDMTEVPLKRELIDDLRKVMEEHAPGDQPRDKYSNYGYGSHSEQGRYTAARDLSQFIKRRLEEQLEAEDTRDPIDKQQALIDELKAERERHNEEWKKVTDKLRDSDHKLHKAREELRDLKTHQFEEAFSKWKETLEDYTPFYKGRQ